MTVLELQKLLERFDPKLEVHLIAAHASRPLDDVTIGFATWNCKEKIVVFLSASEYIMTDMGT